MSTIRRILLHTATMKRVQQKVGEHVIEVDIYAHAGETLEVGSHISEEKADALIAGGGAIEADPLDHDSDGHKGGSVKGSRRKKKAVADPSASSAGAADAATDGAGDDGDDDDGTGDDDAGDDDAGADEGQANA